MDLKTLAKIEYKNWKRRMIDETSGTYVLIYMGFIFEVFISALYGFRYNKDNISTLSGVVAFTVILYQSVTVYLSYVMEKGKRVNIFEKYIYTPVNLAMLRKAKLIVVARTIAFPVIGGQLAALLVRITDPDHQGGSLLDISVCIPVIIGGLFMLVKIIEFRRLCRKAAKTGDTLPTNQ